MNATLLLTRPSLLADAGRPYQIVLDGKAVGEIRNNSSTEIPVVAGTHTLQIRVLTLVGRRPGRGSPGVTFDIANGQAAEFSCHPPAFAQSWFLWVASVLGDPNRFILLEKAR